MTFKQATLKLSCWFESSLETFVVSLVYLAKISSQIHPAGSVTGLSVEVSNFIVEMGDTVTLFNLTTHKLIVPLTSKWPSGSDFFPCIFIVFQLCITRITVYSIIGISRHRFSVSRCLFLKIFIA